ncbi:iron chelate uptake ABC transporter family permease subunit [Amycolatopsis endophytica]|uniref:Iron complex transport system permease protein n=1 Tax=Amycolatopsis endophytica TaxID=860233 RepID=A0A853BCP7_9PSEU|nr:iron chelate uptake ABC transporter family permease subunit [Amycolatopsis endophytica]NYI92524.1 iron complex transport system permease protein [Amycolatopsis endophytica]
MTVRVREWSVRVERRSTVVGVVLALLVIGLWLVALWPGNHVMTPGAVLNTLAGQGSISDEAIVYDWQMPRALTAIGVGMALGTAGAVFQSLTRNPLGSPEILGFTTGSATGALLSLTVLGPLALPTWFGALAGGVISAAVIYAVSYNHGLRPSRLILVGIGVNAILLAVNSLMISRADFYDAKSAANWLIGSLDGRGWSHVVPVAVAVAVLVPLTISRGPALRMIEMGDERARGLGLRVEGERFVLLALGIALISTAVTAAGPVAFVSLAAPHLAKILCRSGTRPLVPSALVGAVLLQASDIAAARATGHLLPVGVVTGLLGGIYLAWLVGRRAPLKQ